MSCSTDRRRRAPRRAGVLAAALLAALPCPRAPAQGAGAGSSIAENLLAAARPRGVVQDFAQLFLPPQREELAQFLDTVEQERRIRILFVSIPDLGDRDAGPYAKTLRERWTATAAERNRSALVLYARDEGVLLVDAGSHLAAVCTNIPPPLLAADLFSEARSPDALRAAAARAINACIPPLADAPPLAFALRSPSGADARSAVGRIVGTLVLALVVIGIVFAFLYIVFRGAGARAGPSDRASDRLEAEWNRLQPLLRQRYALLQDVVAAAEDRLGRSDFAIRELSLALDEWMEASALAGQVEAANRVEKWVPHGIRLGRTHAAGHDPANERRIARILEIDAEMQAVAAAFNRNVSDHNEWVASQSEDADGDLSERAPLFTPARVS